MFSWCPVREGNSAAGDQPIGIRAAATLDRPNCPAQGSSGQRADFVFWQSTRPLLMEAPQVAFHLMVQELWLSGLPEADSLPKEPDAETNEAPQTNTTRDCYQYPAQEVAAIILAKSARQIHRRPVSGFCHLRQGGRTMEYPIQIRVIAGARPAKLQNHRRGSVSSARLRANRAPPQ